MNEKALTLNDIDFTPLIEAFQELGHKFAEIIKGIAEQMTKAFNEFLKSIYGDKYAYNEKVNWKTKVKNAVLKSLSIPKRIYWYLFKRRTN